MLQRTKLLSEVYAHVYKTKANPAQSQSLFSKWFSFGQQHEVSTLLPPLSFSLVFLVFLFISSYLRDVILIKKKVSNGEMRASVIRAECGLLMGMMQLLQESMVGYVKAGWSLRRGYPQKKITNNQKENKKERKNI